MKIGQIKSILNEPNNNTVRSVCFSPNGTIFATCGDGKGNIYFWELETEKLLYKLEGYSTDCVNFSPDGTIFAFSCQDNIILLDFEKDELIFDLEGECSSFCFSPNSILLASTNYDSIITLWNVKTGKITQRFDGQGLGMCKVCFSSDGTILASWGGYCSILWDMRAAIFKEQQKQIIDKQEKMILADKEGHKDQVISVDISPDGNMLASTSYDSTVQIWNLKTGELKHKLYGLTYVCFSPDGKLLAYSNNNSIDLWDLKYEMLIQTLHISSHDKNVCFSPDSTMLAISSWDYYVYLWDLKQAKSQKKIIGKHYDKVNSVCFSPDGQILASGGKDGRTNLWNVKTEEHLFELLGYSKVINSVCFSPDGTLVANGGEEDPYICIWDVRTGELKIKLGKFRYRVHSICFSPDGSIIASGSEINAIHLWDVKTGRLKQKLEGHHSRVNSVRFSSDGTILASGSSDHSIRLWDVHNAQNSQLSLKCENHRKPNYYHDLHPNVKLEFLSNSLQLKTSLATHVISKLVLFQAYNAVVYKGTFHNRSGMNLKAALEQRGCIILDKFLK